MGGSGTGTKFVSQIVNLGTTNEDLILKAGSCYWINVINHAGRDIRLSYEVNMYEHKN